MEIPLVEVVTATVEHADDLGPRLRAGDAIEVAALGMTGAEALRHAFVHSFIVKTALYDARPVAMWGASSTSWLSDHAYLWMLTGNNPAPSSKHILRLSRPFVLALQEQFRTLEALVDAEYHQALRWLHWLGFRDGAVSEIGGRAFMHMRRER